MAFLWDGHSDSDTESDRAGAQCYHDDDGPWHVPDSAYEEIEQTVAGAPSSCEVAPSRLALAPRPPVAAPSRRVPALLPRNLASIEVWDPSGFLTTIDDIELDIIETKNPEMAHRFRRTNHFGIATYRPVLTIREVSVAAVTSMMQYVVLDDTDYKVLECDFRDRCSLLLHLHVLKLAMDFNLPELAQKARFNFTEDIELSCYTDNPPHEFCEAIRFLYTKLRHQFEMRQSIAHYCVSCYNYHRLHLSEAFRQTFFECIAFHKDLLLANLRSDFSASSALEIIHLPVCPNPIHRTHEAWTTGSTDFMCQFHDGTVFESHPNTPRAGPQTMTEDQAPPEYALALPPVSPAVTPLSSITPVPSSPAASSQGSWTDVDSDAEWSDMELPPSYEAAVQEALLRFQREDGRRTAPSVPLSLPRRSRQAEQLVEPWNGEDEDDNYGDDEEEEEDDDDGNKTDTEEGASSSAVNLALRPKEMATAARPLSDRQADKLPLRERTTSTALKNDEKHSNLIVEALKDDKQQQQQQQQQNKRVSLIAEALKNALEEGDSNTKNNNNDIEMELDSDSDWTVLSDRGFWD